MTSAFRHFGIGGRFPSEPFVMDKLKEAEEVGSHADPHSERFNVMFKQHQSHENVKRHAVEGN